MGNCQVIIKTLNLVVHHCLWNQSRRYWGPNMLLGPTPASLVLCLMIIYSKIFSKYPKAIPIISLTKSLKVPVTHKNVAL
jgi:hypothetical protein